MLTSRDKEWDCAQGRVSLDERAAGAGRRRLECPVMPTRLPKAHSALGFAAGRNSYLIAAICFALMAIMLFPLAMSLLTSVKPSGEAAMWPPNYLPSRLSFSNYIEMFNYQAGLPLYLFNSFSVAFMTIGGCVVLASLAGFGLARFSISSKEIFFFPLFFCLIISFLNIPTPPLLMFLRARLQNN